MKIFTILLIFLAFASFCFGQTVKDEINDLKVFLAVPEKTEIKLKPSIIFEKSKSLKVYLAFGLDTQVFKNFDKWIDEWNKKEAKKYMLLEKVGDISAADIVLVRYTKKDKVSSETNSKVVSTMTIDPKTQIMTTTPVQQTYSVSVVPVLAYILKTNSENLDILDRYSDTASASDNKDSGKFLWEKFKEMLKKK